MKNKLIKMMLLLILALSGIGSFFTGRQNAFASDMIKFTASDGVDYDWFGTSVALDGNYAVIGADGDDNNGTQSGSVYIYNTDTGALVRRITPADGVTNACFGFSVDITGVYAIIGAPYDDDNGVNSGSVYIYDVTTGALARKIVPADGHAGAFFGYSVSVSGNYVIVGATIDNSRGDNSGVAYIYNFQTGTLLRKIVEPTASASGKFGYSVSLSGDYAIVGSPDDYSNGYYCGAAYIYNIQTGDMIRRLVPLDNLAGDYFGRSVAIYGDYAVIGAYTDQNGNVDTGSAYVYNIHTGKLLHQLSLGITGSKFGASVDISNECVIVGACEDNTVDSFAGSTSIFNLYTGALIKQIAPADVAYGDYLGYSVAVSGTKFLTGLRYDDDMGNESGSAYFEKVTMAPVANNQSITVVENTSNDVTLTAIDLEGDTLTYSVLSQPSHGSLSGSGSSFTYTPANDYVGTDSFTFMVNDGNEDSNTATVSITVMSLLASTKFISPDGVDYDWFGTSVALDGNYAVIGTSGDDNNGTQSGSIYIYNTDTGAFVRRIIPADGVSYACFGTSVDVLGDYVLVGAPYDDDNGVNSGSVYVYNISTGVLSRKIVPADGHAGAFFGYSISVSGDYVIVGAYVDNSRGDNSGVVYIYNFHTGALLRKIVEPTAYASGRFGYSVSMYGDYAIVGSPHHYENGYYNGAVFVYNVQTGALLRKIIPADNEPGDYFGISAALHGDYAVIGSYTDQNGNIDTGSAYVYNIQTGALIHKLSLGITGSKFGSSVDISNNCVVVGACEDNTVDSFAGSTSVFDLQSGSLIKQIAPSDVAFGDYLGYSVAVSGKKFLTGLRYDDDMGNESGSAYLERIAAANTAPVANDQSVTTDEDTPVNITLTATDVDNDALTYSVVTPPSHGFLTGSGANLTYTPYSDYNGSDSFTFKANDGTEDSNVATVSVTVNPVAESLLGVGLHIKPTGAVDSGIMNIRLTGDWENENEFEANDNTVHFDGVDQFIWGDTIYSHFLCNRPGTALAFRAGDTFDIVDLELAGSDTDPLVLRSSIADNWWYVNVSNPNVTYVDVKDSNAAGGTTILPTNSVNSGNTVNWWLDIPTLIAPADESVLTSSDVVFSWQAFDGADSYKLTVINTATSETVYDSNVNNVTTKSVTLANGAYSWNLTAYVGVEFAVSETWTFTVDVDNVDPVISNLTPADNSTIADLRPVISATYTDEGSGIDQSSVVVTLNGGDITANVTVTATGISYTPSSDLAEGNYNVSLTVSDIAGNTANSTWSFTVSTNIAPVAQDMNLVVSENTSTAVTLTATDADNDELTFTVEDNPSHGVLSGTAPDLTYTPAVGYVGSDSFTFKANDGTVDSNTATVSITVNELVDENMAVVGEWLFEDVVERFEPQETPFADDDANDGALWHMDEGTNYDR